MLRGGSRIWQWGGGGGGKNSSEASYIYKRSELHIQAKRVTREASYERSELRGKRVTEGSKRVTREASYEGSELRAKRVTSEASINQLGVRGAL